MKNKKMMIILLVAIIAAGTTYMFIKNSEASKSAVRVTSLKSGFEGSRVQLEGVVAPEDSAITDVFAEVPVVIDRIEITAGSLVKKGDNILAFSEEAKREVEKSLDEINVQLSSQESVVDSMERQARNAKYEADVSLKQLAVNKKLLRESAISSIEVAKSESLANKNIANFEDYTSRKEVEFQKYRLLANKKEEIEKKLEFVQSDLKAPMDGIITELAVQNGSVLKEGQKIFSMVQEGKYRVIIEAPATLIGSITEGSSATVRDLSSGGKTYEGTVEKVSRVARDDSRKNKIIDIEVKLNDAQGLNPGFLTSVEIAGTGNAQAKMVDSFSVVEEGDKAFVYMIQDGKIARVPVNLGIKTSSKFEILDLPEGTEIVVNPSRVKVGEQVRVIK